MHACMHVYTQCDMVGIYSSYSNQLLHTRIYIYIIYTLYIYIHSVYTVYTLVFGGYLRHLRLFALPLGVKAISQFSAQTCVFYLRIGNKYGFLDIVFYPV